MNDNETRPHMLAQLLDAFHDHGMRPVEVASLRWNDVDLAAETMTIRSVKSGARVVQINAPVAALLRLLASAIPSHGFVFDEGISIDHAARANAINCMWTDATD